MTTTRSYARTLLPGRWDATRGADFWRERGYPSREAHVRGVIERWLAEWRAA